MTYFITNQNIGALPPLRPQESRPGYRVLDYSLDLGEETTDVLGLGILEWSFLGALVFLVGVVSLFMLYIVAQLFRIHSRR